MKWADRNCGNCAFYVRNKRYDPTDTSLIAPCEGHCTRMSQGSRASTSAERCGEHRTEAEMDMECGKRSKDAAAWVETKGGAS